MGLTLPATGQVVETADVMGTGSRQAMALVGVTGNKSPVNLEDAASADGDAGIVMLAKRAATPGNTSGTDGDYEPLQVSGGRAWVDAILGDGTNHVAVKATTIPAAASDPAMVVAISPNNRVGVFGYQATVTGTITHPGNTTTYTTSPADAYADTTPTAGGFVLTGMGYASGGSGVISDIMVINSSPTALALQGELWIFDTTVTAIADNAAWALSDTDSLKQVAIIPFALNAYPSNASQHLTNLGIGYTCVGSANLYFLVRVTNAYIPVSGETLTVRVKCIQNT